MSDQEIQNIWKSSRVGLHIHEDKLINDLNQTIKHFDKGIASRNLRETLAGILVTIFFTTISFFIPGILAKTGAIICSLYGIIVIYILHHVSKQKKTDPSLSLKEYLVHYKIYLIQEKKILDNIIYWYLLPPTVGALMIIAGTSPNGISLLIMVPVIVIMNVFIFYLNRRSVQRTIAPLLSSLSQNIEQLENH